MDVWQGDNLSEYLVNAGPHPLWGEEGWQIAFDFGSVQVSIAECPNTEGVELMVLQGFERTLVHHKHVTPAQVVDVLAAILVWRGAR